MTRVGAGRQATYVAGATTAGGGGAGGTAAWLVDGGVVCEGDAKDHAGCKRKGEWWWWWWGWGW